MNARLRVAVGAAALVLLSVAAPPPALAADTVVPAVADTFVNSGSPKTRFGTRTNLKVGTSPERRTFLRFDLRNVPGPIQKVTLRVLPDATTANGISVRGVADDTWSEATTTWRLAPAFSSTSTTSVASLTRNVRTSLDVTSLLTSDRVMSLALVTRAGSGTTGSMFSRETGANGPQLLVQTADPAPDTTAPSVQLTAPAAGSTLSGTATLAATAADDVGVARVEFLAGGAVVGVDGTAPFSAAWDTTTVADGPATLTARAVDGAGNAALSAERTVTVKNADDPPPPEDDTTAPQTTLTSGPAGIQRTAIARPAFSADEDGATFQCRLDAGVYVACRSGEAIHVPNGRHTLAVRAIDAAGNVDPTPVERTWWADATLQNGLFEADPRGWNVQGLPTPGWAPYLGTVTILPGGVSGNKARVEVLAGQQFFSLDTSPHPVDASTAGARYTATGLVRSDQPGRRVCLQVRERNDAGAVGATRQCVTTTTGWTAFPATTRIASANGNRIEVDVFQDTTAVAGDSFEVDGLELADGVADAPGPPAAPAGDPVLLGLGDIASCWSSGDEATARLLDTLGGTIASVGDNEQNKGTADEYRGCFEPAWGRHVDRMRPALGDHEYNTPGAEPSFDFFGSAIGPRGKGWYSYELGDWHIVVLNSNCGQVGGCGPGSEQYAWLEADLAANAKDCTAAYFHHPLFSAGSLHGGLPYGRPFWDVLHRFGAEFVMGGNDHTYQRFAPQTPDGVRDDARGMRQFVVGTGGTMHYPLGAPLANTEVQNNDAFGALKLTLRAGTYDWQFVSQSGRTFTDSGSAACSPLDRPDAEAPRVTLTAPEAGAEVRDTVTLTADATDTGTGIDRVEFLAGGTVVGTDTTAPYSAEWNSAGSTGAVSLTARAVDGAGNAATSAPVGVIVVAGEPAVNLMPNGSFETGTTGWYRYRATLARVPGGQDGAYAVRVTYGGTGSSYSIMTDPHPIGATVAGERYTATAWVRSETPGRRVCLRMREFNASRVAIGSSTAACATTSGSWQPLPDAVHTALGGASMEVYAYSESPLAGDSFDLDAVSAIRR